MKMKIPDKIILLAGALFLWSSFPAAAEATVQQVYEDAIRAYHSGDLVSAKAGLERVVRADPRFSTARAQLAVITHKLKEREASGATAMQRDLESVIVPSIDFNDATLGSVIEFIPQKTAELTDKKIQPSIVFRGDPALLTQKKVTLKLTNMPMSEVLRYVGELTGIEFKFEKYAIVASPRGSKPAAAANPKAPEKNAGKAPFGDKPAANPFK